MLARLSWQYRYHHLSSTPISSSHTSTPSIIARTQFFQPGSSVHSLLSPQIQSPSQNVVFTEARSHVQTYAQLGVLIYLNVTAWNYRYEPDKLLVWLNWIQHEVMANYKNSIPTPHGLSLALVWQEKSLQQDIERAWTWWFTAWTLRLCKRLGVRLREEVRGFLLACLTLEREVERPNEEDVRQEILGQLYVPESSRQAQRS